MLSIYEESRQEAGFGAMREEGASPLEQSSRGEPCKTPAAISSAGARVSRTGPGRWLGSLPRIDALAGRIGSHQIGALGRRTFACRSRSDSGAHGGGGRSCPELVDSRRAGLARMVGGASRMSADGRDCLFVKLADSSPRPTERSRRRSAARHGRELVLAARSRPSPGPFNFNTDQPLD